MSFREDPALSRQERLEVFRIATRALPKRYADEVAAGMTDDELGNALAEVLGIFGGSGGPNRPWVAYQGAGLKIWGGRTTINHYREPPLFKGTLTIAMAREVYRIADPAQRQASLF